MGRHGRNLVDDLDRGAGRAAARLNASAHSTLLDAVLLGDLDAGVAKGANGEASKGTAAPGATAQPCLFHGGTEDASPPAIQLAAAADAAVLDIAAAAEAGLPRRV